MSWFRINIGRERNADPRWLLPLICRAGGVTKTEIGAIRIEQRETRFQILAEAADQFELTARTSPKKEGHIVRVDGGAAGDIGGILDEIENIAPSSAPSRPAGSRRPDAKPHGAAAKTGPGDKSRWRKRTDGETSGAKPQFAKPRWSKDAAGGDDKRKPHRRTDRPADNAAAKIGDNPLKKKKRRAASSADT